MSRQGWLLVLTLLAPVGLAPARASDDDAPLLTEEPHRTKTGTADDRLDAALLAMLARPRPAGPAEAAPARVRVYVHVAGPPAEAVAALGAHGLEVELASEPLGVVQGLVTLDGLRALALLPFVKIVTPADEAHPSVGRATTEGDALLHADAVRALGYDGTGTTVGVISDGANHLADAVASGDLATVTIPADARCKAGEGDEGTAMLEIVHDVAPGASLFFAGVRSSAEYINAVACLADAGARVIVDDFSFFGEPYFEDGPLALAVRAVVGRGVSVHGAVGNYASSFITQTFTTTDGQNHTFAPNDEGADVNVQPGQHLQCFLQWNDPFGGSANDYNLYLFRKVTNERVAFSENKQTGTQRPFEKVEYTNASDATDHLFLVVWKAPSAAVRTFMVLCPDMALQHATAGGIFGQNQLPEVVAAGDVRATSPDVVEAHSSRGPVAAPGREIRNKPDLVAVDGVQISNAGGFPPACPAGCVADPASSPDCPTRCAFYGTSAAAPHSAAVAALLLGRNVALSPDHLQRILTGTAVDIEAAGYDVASGFGRIDASAAIQAVCVADGACDDGTVCTTDRCDAGLCEHAPVRCDDGEACNGAERCDPAAGCVAGTPPVGLALVRCELDALVETLRNTGAVQAKLRRKLLALGQKARRAVDVAKGSRSARRVAAALTRIGKTATRIEAQVTKAAARGKMPGELAAGLVARVGEVRGGLAGA